MSVMYPIAGGFFACLATIVGSVFFNLERGWLELCVGIGLFSACNYLLYKLKFNSYSLNGSTVTTVLIFTSQVFFMGLWNYHTITYRWVVGVLFILLGTLMLESSHDKYK